MQIEFCDVCVTFQDRKVLKNIDLTLQQKKIGVIGANGAGKSTFLRLLNGLILPDIGEVRIFGLDTKQYGRKIREKVGFVFQNPDNQIIMPLVEEDLAFGLKNLRLSKLEIKERIDAFLERYDLEDLRKRPSHFLSGGQKQLLAFGSVLVMQPELIICDEPTSQLDYKNSLKIKRLLENLECSLVLASHDFALLENFERVLVFDEGQIVFDGLAEEAIAFYLNLIENDG